MDYLKANISEPLNFVACGNFISEENWTHMKRINDNFEIIIGINGTAYIQQDHEKSEKKGNMALQIDVCYTPYPVQGSRWERGHFPRLFIIADKNNGTIVDIDVYEDIDEDANVTLNKLINLCLSNGVPKEIQVRDDKMVAILQDFCQKTGINLKKVNQLRTIDDMIAEMANRTMF
ncbi:DUF6930 domain-containing protein [Clostridium thermarum]|uniref:DUF6930 domain-containing protein n=1 Tax=Clostridium thermarum TaxID=1716543 RepID=UPI00112136D1|nr:hypothetical protein [Clostridium thermarum]